MRKVQVHDMNNEYDISFTPACRTLGLQECANKGGLIRCRFLQITVLEFQADQIKWWAEIFCTAFKFIPMYIDFHRD